MTAVDGQPEIPASSLGGTTDEDWRKTLTQSVTRIKSTLENYKIQTKKLRELQKNLQRGIFQRSGARKTTVRERKQLARVKEYLQGTSTRVSRLANLLRVYETILAETQKAQV